jgi:serine/threonine protein kinase
LSWERRLRIALGVAHGLAYLHTNTGFGQVLHCDLKPTNILLDHDFDPRIADFGISRLIVGNCSRPASMSAMHGGSIGYLAPGRNERSDLSGFFGQDHVGARLVCLSLLLRVITTD